MTTKSVDMAASIRLGWYIRQVQYGPIKRTTSVPELLLAIGRDAPTPLRVQLERELRTAIQTGRLRQEMPLPSSRALAADLSLSRRVVVEAYEQLLAEGYLIARRGSATRVATRTTRAVPSAHPSDRRRRFATTFAPACLTSRHSRVGRGSPRCGVPWPPRPIRCWGTRTPAAPSRCARRWRPTSTARGARWPARS